MKLTLTQPYLQQSEKLFQIKKIQQLKIIQEVYITPCTL